ncbi:MAG: DUF1441 family protein [Pyrinomonadaceae bacterium]
MSSKTGTEKGYSISALARMAGVDRRTLASRLAGVTPLESGPKGKLYRLSDVVQNFITQPLQGEDDPALEEARRRKLEAEAGLAELKLQKERGEVVQSADVREDLVEVIRSLHTRLAVTMPQQLGPRLQAKTAQQATALLSAEVGRVFAELRAEHVQYLAEWDAAAGGAGGQAEAGA